MQKERAIIRSPCNLELMDSGLVVTSSTHCDEASKCSKVDIKRYKELNWYIRFNYFKNVLPKCLLITVTTGCNATLTSFEYIFCCNVSYVTENPANKSSSYALCEIMCNGSVDRYHMKAVNRRLSCVSPWYKPDWPNVESFDDFLSIFSCPFTNTPDLDFLKVRFSSFSDFVSQSTLTLFCV